MGVTANYGVLLNEQAIKYQRRQFNEMVRLLGINVTYFSIKNKHFSNYSELISDPKNGITVGCIFTDHIDQKTQRKLGWNAELVENALVLNMPYDTPDIEVGCLVMIPSGLDNAPPRLFRISRMSNIMIYPASITCECVPEFADVLPKNQTEDFRVSSFNVLMKDEDDNL